MRARIISGLIVGVLLTATPAQAAGPGVSRYPFRFVDTATAPGKPLNLQITFGPTDVLAFGSVSTPPQSAAPAPAFEYSEGYQVRGKIHKLASWAMLPLFGVEAFVGQKMFNDAGSITDGTRTLHRSIAWGIGGLFAINTVTGVPNLIESRRDPQKSDLTLIHGILMLVADAGFLTTALTQPNSRTSSGLEIYTPKKNQHMTIAYASISVATVSYLLMLFGK